VGGTWEEFGAQKIDSGANTTTFPKSLLSKPDQLILNLHRHRRAFDSFELIKTSNGPNKLLSLRATAIPGKSK